MKAIRIFSMILATCLLTTAGCSTTHAPDNPGRHAADDRFDRGTDREPSPRTLHAMARILASQHHDEQARHVLERCIARHPRFSPAYSELAQLHMRNSRIDLAIQVFEGADPAVLDDPVTVNNLGVCYLLLGEYEHALPFFKTAAGLDPDNARYQANHAMTLGMLGQFEHALDAYRAILTEGEAHYNLAVLHEARREQTRAGQHYRHAEALGYRPKDGND